MKQLYLLILLLFIARFAFGMDSDNIGALTSNSSPSPLSPLPKARGRSLCSQGICHPLNDIPFVRSKLPLLGENLALAFSRPVGSSVGVRAQNQNETTLPGKGTGSEGFFVFDFYNEMVTTLKKEVILRADEAMKQMPQTITMFKCERSSGGIHDFYSEGDYWWPDPKNPQGPYIKRDGMTNPDNFVAHRKAMIRFSQIIGTMASAYKITGDEKYVKQALIHLKAWFVDTTTRMNPSLLYAQAIKGLFTGRGIGIIDTIQLMEVAQGIIVMQGAPSFDKNLLAAIKSWFVEYLQWLTTHPYGKDEMNATNNHGTCWAMQVASFAKLTGNTTLLDFCRNRYKEVFLPKQMADNGSFPRELERTKPFGYSLFNLDAMTMMCQVLSDEKNDLWNYQTPDGKCIRKGIEFLFPFIADKNKWPYTKDVMYWDNWPVAQPALLFGANAFQKQEWFTTWKSLEHFPYVEEVIRNLPIRNPIIWMEDKNPNKGDEDADMTNSVQPRDQQAIDNAIHGWWAASMKTHDERIAWWRDARFGMFIHWGIYSLPAGEWKGKKVSGYSEHLMRKEKITKAEYLDVAHQFNPEKFNADEWVLTARKAGMRYLIITAKHHDGFAMYNSQISDFNIVQQTPFKHDPMTELAAACKKYGIRFGFYYSHAFDWEHPDAPGNDWEYKNPGGDLNLFGGKNWYNEHPELLVKAIKYVDEKAIPQIKELLTKYHPDILWFDTPHKLPLSENIRILKAIRETDPNVVINGRLARSSTYTFGDYKNTADRPAEFYPVEGDWEAIPTTNESYGHHKFDHSHKPASFFVRLIAKAASRGGNLLMNIGPMGNGQFDTKDMEILKGIGNWMDKNSESIYGTTQSPLALQNWGVCTQKDNILYLHVFGWPKDGNLIVGGLKSEIKKAYLLKDASKKGLQVKRLDPIDVSINVPLPAPDTINTVIVLETQGKLEADPVRLLSTATTNRLLAFDAELSGKGFRFGDGKTNKYFVEGWKQKDQKISWTVRLNRPATYKILVKYIGSPQNEGVIRLLSDKNILKEEKTPAQQKEEIITLDAGAVSWPKGLHELSLEPAEITQKELIKLLEVQLVPVK